MSRSVTGGKSFVVAAPGEVRDWEGLARQAHYRPGELANLCQISLRTLQRHFQKHYRLRVISWLRELRMSDAYQKLQSGSSVKEVAFDLGYKQHSHFTRDFKQRFGVPPSFLLPSARPRLAPVLLESPTNPQFVFTF